MILVKITGGLGNQMFQYAAAKYVASKIRETVYFDKSFFQNPNHLHEVFRLNEFNTKGISLKPVYWNFPILYTHWFFRKIPFIRRFIHSFQEDILQENFEYNVSDLKLVSNSYINGLWHTKFFADSIREELLNEFTPKNIEDKRYFEIKKNMINQKSVSIHVRRNDFINHERASSISGALGMDYYIKAIDFFRKDYQDLRFYFFSDDIEWCKTHFQDDDFCFIDPFQSPILDLTLMSFCSHTIMANSTFSWWGAWLNLNLKKRVIYPKNFYKNKSNDDIRFMFDKTWIEL